MSAKAKKKAEAPVSKRVEMINKVRGAWEKQSKKSKAWKAIMTGLLALILCAWTILSLFGSQFIVAGGMRLIIDIFNLEIVDTNVAQAVMHIISCLLAVAMIVFVPKFLLNEGTSRNELGLRGLLTWQDIGLAVVGFIVALIGAGLVNAVVQMIFPNIDLEQAQDVGYESVHGGLPMLLVFVSLVIAAPVMEEILFRGWLYGKLRTRMIAVPAILIDAALFGAAHMQLNVAITVGVMAAVMCVIRELTGTIWSGMLVHMMKNGLAFYLLYVIGMG